MREFFADRLFGVVAVAYLAVIVELTCCLGRYKPADRDYLAARDLPLNHRIVAADLRSPPSLASRLGFFVRPVSAIEGRYVRGKPIAAGAPIAAAALADRPDTALPDKTLAVAFPVSSDSSITSALDAGSPVTLVGTDSDTKAPIAIPATVHAILCAPAKDAAQACYPLLYVPAEQGAIVGKNLSTLRLALRYKP
jgi:hypothetical protein